MLQMLDFLERAGELAAAARNGPLLARCGRLAHHRRMQRARAAGRKFVRLRRFRPLLRNHSQHLRDHVTGTLDHHRIADAHAEALDLVGVVQRGVLHDDTANGDRLELGDRRERAGAADLNLDRLDDGRRLLGGKFVRDRPTRVARDEAEPLLPIQPIDLVAAPRSRGGTQASSRSSRRLA